MSEGRTPTATLTLQRRLEPEDVDILHQIVIRAQNDALSQDRPKDALLQAYGEIFGERQLNTHQDQACFNVLLKLLNPATPGASLYHKFEGILQEEGIELSYDDDATTQDERRQAHESESTDDSGDIVSPSRMIEDSTRPRFQAYRQSPLKSAHHVYTQPPEPKAVQANSNQVEDEWLDNPPTYIPRLLQQAESRDKAVLARQTLDAWRNALEESRMRQLEQRANALYEMRLKRKVLKQCIAVFQDLQESQSRADQIYRHKLARNVLGKTSDEYRVRRIGTIDDDRVKGLSLYKWTIATREAAFARNKDQRLKQAVMQRLSAHFREAKAKEAQLQQLLRDREAQMQGSLLRAAIGLLTEKVVVAKEQEAKAEIQDQNSLRLASINAWRVKMGRLEDLNVTAEDAREYFLMKRVLSSIKAATQYRKDRRAWLATWTLRKWQKVIKDRKHARYDEAYRQMRRTIKINLARTLLLRWRERAQIIREDDVRADATYHNSLLERVGRPFIEKIYDKSEWSKRNELLADTKAGQFLLQRAVLAIEYKSHALTEMADRADRWQQYRLEQRAVQALRQMQLKAFELQRRQADADAFIDRRNKRAVRSMLAMIRHSFAQRRMGTEGALNLSMPAATPARKRAELLLQSSTRFSTTPAGTPFAAQSFTQLLQNGPRIMSDIEEGLEEGDDEDSMLDNDMVP